MPRIMGNLFRAFGVLGLVAGMVPDCGCRGGLEGFAGGVGVGLAELGEGLFEVGDDGLVVGVFVLIKDFSRIADEVVEFPLIEIVEIDEFVVLGANAVVASDEVAGAPLGFDHLVVVVKGISPIVGLVALQEWH